MKPSRRDPVGGGLVADFFRGLQKPTRFSGGGSSRFFPWSPKATAIQWGGSGRTFPWSPQPTRFRFDGGGVVAEFFRGLQKPPRFSGGEVQ